jgi:competence protein ComEC
MLAVNPGWVSDLGFILSFVATGSLMLFEKDVDSKLRFVPGIFREGLATSLAAQIGVAPILIFTFGRFNLLSPIINGLVLWTIAPITVLGLVAGIVSLFVPLVGKLILFLIYPLSAWFVWVVELFNF